MTLLLSVPYTIFPVNDIRLDVICSMFHEKPLNIETTTKTMVRGIHFLQRDKVTIVILQESLKMKYKDQHMDEIEALKTLIIQVASDLSNFIQDIFLVVNMGKPLSSTST